MAKITQPKDYTYEGWAQVLGLAESKRIGHNTYAERTAYGDIAIRYHWTHVVTYERDGRIRLNSGGYQTSTTKQRMNACLPMSVRVFQEDFVWYVRHNAWADGERIDFRDMMVIVP